jgi:signal transduction histidine kinase
VTERAIRQRWGDGERPAEASLFVALIAAIAFLAATETSGWQRMLVVVLSVAAAATVLVRRRYPYALVAVAWVTAALVTQILLVPALFSLALHRRDRLSLAAVGGTIILLGIVASRGERFVSIDGVDLDTVTSTASWLLNIVVVVLVPYLIGWAIGARRELTQSYRLRAEHAEAERAARSREAVLLERARIAREAHDILGHKLALLTMQAGGLEVNAAAGPGVVAQQAQLIRQSARAALDDLRSIIGALEELDSDPRRPTGRPLTPQDLAGVVTLVDQSRASGGTVDLATAQLESWHGVPQEVGRAAYRVTQEALTNAHRHAPTSPVTVTLSGAPGRGLSVEVRNLVDEPALDVARPEHAGRGLPGLHERVRVVGGSLRVETEDSVFIVRAELPWPAAISERSDPAAVTEEPLA